MGNCKFWWGYNVENPKSDDGNLLVLSSVVLKIQRPYFYRRTYHLLVPSFGELRLRVASGGAFAPHGYTN